MADLVHLMPERLAARVRSAGLAARSLGRAGGCRGVYVMPRLRSYTLTHQWAREVRRWHPGPVVAVDVRLPDDEPVWAGRYWQPHRVVTAAQSVTVAEQDQDPRGFEVFVPRRIAAAEVRRIRRIVRPVGWRYLPDAHGRRPCACPVCLAPGTYAAAGVRRRFAADPPPQPTPTLVAQLRTARTPNEIIDALWALASRRPGVAEELEFLLDHPDDEVRAAVAETLPYFRGTQGP